MSDKKLIVLLLAVGFVIILTELTLYAESQVPDEITMNDNKYTKRKYTPPKYKVLTFSHKKHNIDYKISCGECHHDEKGNPLENLKIGDNVQKCVECHTELKKTKKNRKTILLLENAMHGSCMNCHKKINIEAGDPKGKKGPAPFSCKECHIKVLK